MPLSRIAAQLAAEIKLQDWSDAPYRHDRAGHDRETDRTTTQQLSPKETTAIKWNVAWVTGQVLGYNDPNFDEYEYFEACGISTRTNSGAIDGGVETGLRIRGKDAAGNRRFDVPGTYSPDPEPTE